MTRGSTWNIWDFHLHSPYSVILHAIVKLHDAGVEAAAIVVQLRVPIDNPMNRTWKAPCSTTQSFVRTCALPVDRKKR